MIKSHVSPVSTAGGGFLLIPRGYCVASLNKLLDEVDNDRSAALVFGSAVAVAYPLIRHHGPKLLDHFLLSCFVHHYLP
jgi:hypothetical protein